MESSQVPTHFQDLFGKEKVILALAPMEGVMDYSFRQIITQFQGIDFCVTEFMRVVSSLHSEAHFLKYCPELKTNSRTKSGTPVIFQLLGSDPIALAENAARACELGALGIDLNFGCPAKTVNRHDGGASLLKTPERIFKVIEAVRKSVPKEKPVSAKIRLGFDKPEACVDVAPLAQAAGASWLTVHCRTKLDGYKPGAKWEWIPKMRELVEIPLIVNGDIDSPESFEKCRSQTQERAFMIGRASLSNPLVFSEIKNANESSLAVSAEAQKTSWEDTQHLIRPFFELSSQTVSPWYAQSRTKQWLNILRQRHSQAKDLFETVKTIKDPIVFEQHLM